MNFEIVARKDTDRYVIKDCQTGGMCCCSKYTIKQLIDLGHTVKGVKLNPFTVKLAGGSVENIPDTKRSATTILKGIKPAVCKQQKKIVKVSRLQKTKCVAILQRINIKASEYDSTEEYEFCLKAYSPAALTAMRKLSREFSHYSNGFYISDEAGRILKSKGVYSCNARLIDDLSLADGIQLVCNPSIVVRYENNYEDSRANITYSLSNNYQPTFAYAERLTPDPNVELGSTANGRV